MFEGFNGLKTGFCLMDRLQSIVDSHPDILLFEPSNPTPTAADAAKECNVREEQIVKTVILVTKKGNERFYFAAILCGNDQIDQNILKRILDVKIPRPYVDMQMASVNSQ